MKKIIMLLTVCFAASAAGGWNPGPCSKLNSLAVSSIRHYEQNYRSLESKAGSFKIFICADGLQLPLPYDSIDNAYIFSLKNTQFKKLINSPIKRTRWLLKKEIEAYFVKTWLEGDKLIVGLFLKKGRIGNREDLWTETDRMAYVYRYCEEDGKWRKWVLDETKRNFDIPQNNPLNLMAVSCIKNFRTDEDYNCKDDYEDYAELTGKTEASKMTYVCEDALQEPFPYVSIDNASHFSCYNKITGELKKLLRKYSIDKDAMNDFGLPTIFVKMNFVEKDLVITIFENEVYMDKWYRWPKRKSVLCVYNNDDCNFIYRYYEKSGKWELVEPY